MDTKTLEKLGVHNLRNYARTIGVKSPTAKNKAQLIDEIIQIEQGSLTPSAKSKRGRPTAKSVEITELLTTQTTALEYSELIQKYEKLKNLIISANDIMSEVNDIINEKK